jgi:hypothetical protein
MLHIVCVNAGNYLGRGAQYVNILFDSVRRNLAEGYEARFICFTDDAAGLDPRIETKPLPVPGLNGWWNKLALFKPGVFEDGDRVLYLDLDTVITGRLDEIAAYDGDFAILRDVYRPNGFQSSVMAWRIGFENNIWQSFADMGFPQIQGGDQAWIEASYRGADILQDKFPNLFVSYKASGGAIPDKASVVFFHGLPRPHEVTIGWVPQVWKIGGLTRAEIDTVCNTEREKLFDNVRTNIKRDVSWFDLAPAHDGHAVIVGGGPSTKDRLDEIRWRQSLGQQIWALNGAASWLRSNALISDVLVIADARPGNIEFIRPKAGSIMLPLTKRYLLASQCDPALFGAAPDHQISLWHSHAPGVEEVLKDETVRPVHLIGGGSTGGLAAMQLAHAWGYRKIHLYGFDSSLANDGAHHAYAQPGNDADAVVDVLFGDRQFRSTPWMVQQAQEFCHYAAEMAEDGTIITVAGDGLLPTMAKAMMVEPILSPADQRCREIMRRLGNIPRPVGAEIGVFAGDMSASLLRSMPTLTLYMVDSWEGNGAAYSGDSGDWHAGLSDERQSAYRARAIEQTAFAGPRAIILAQRSQDAASRVADASLDFVFIDADHSEEGCRADIAAWLPKLRPGALLCGHDYGNTAFAKFGVTQAVDAFAEEHGLPVEIGDNFCWFIRLPSDAALAA